jgi:hypothetical protein
MVQVVAHVQRRQRRDATAHRDELEQRISGQLLETRLQIGLADEDDPQRAPGLGRRGVDRGQLAERGARERVRVLHDQKRRLILLADDPERAAQRREPARAVVGAAGLPAEEPHRLRQQQLGGRAGHGEPLGAHAHAPASTGFAYQR